MEEFTLPIDKVKAEVKNPKNLVIFAKPKVGKTELLAGLPDCLILDLESGTDYVDAFKICSPMAFMSLTDVALIFNAST